MAQRGSDFNTHRYGLKSGPIGSDDVDAATLLIFVKGRFRREADWHEAHAGKLTRVEIIRQPLSIEPRRPEHFERCVSSPPDGDICRFQQSDSWIQRRLCK